MKADIVHSLNLSTDFKYLVHDTQHDLDQEKLRVINEHCIILSHNLLYHVQTRISNHLNYMSVLTAPHPDTSTLDMM
jgi:hypothetical protein